MAPRGIRNNNPGNIEYGPFARSMGAIGSDGRFAIFPDAMSGIRAIAALQRSYEKRGLLSPAARIGRWAPSSENNTGAYAGSVAKGMGITSSTPFSFRDANKADDAAFIKAMISVENGRNPYSDATIASALGSGSALDAVNSYAPPAPRAMAYTDPGFSTRTSRYTSPSPVSTQAGMGTTINYAPAYKPSRADVGGMGSWVRPPVVSNPLADARVANRTVPYPVRITSDFKPGSWLQEPVAVPTEIGVSAGLPPVTHRPVRPLVQPPAIQVDPAGTATRPGLGSRGGLLGLGILPRLLGLGGTGTARTGLFNGGLLGRIFGNTTTTRGAGTPTDGGGYTGLLSGSRPFITPYNGPSYDGQEAEHQRRLWEPGGSSFTATRTVSRGR